MVAIKKTIKVFDVIDSSEYTGKIDSIIKKIIPKEMLKKK